MANYYARATGNINGVIWSTTPAGVASDLFSSFTTADTLYSNSFAVTVNVSAAVNEIRNDTTNGATGGGSFTLTNNVPLTANVGTGAVPCVGFTTGSTTLVGSVTAGTSSNSHGINMTSVGTLNVFGNVFGGLGTGSSIGINNTSSGTINLVGNVLGGGSSSGASSGIVNASTGTINITGNVTGGSVTAGHYGINNSSTGPINIVGNVLGGSVTSQYGINNNSIGTVTVTGNVSGGPAASSFGIFNNTTGSINIYGTASGGIGANGVNNNSSGYVYCTKIVGNSFGLGSVGLASTAGLQNSQNGKAYVEQVEFGARGQTPISGPVYILPSNRNTLVGYTTAIGTPVTFYNSLSVTDLLPPVSSVRLGTVYNVGNSTGTMAVPSASAVQFGVAVDNTTGTAALQPQDVWGYARLSATQVNSLGDRLRNVATTQSVGQQIASFNL